MFIDDKLTISREDINKKDLGELGYTFLLGLHKPHQFTEATLNEASKRSLEILSVGLKIVYIIAFCTRDYFQQIICIMFNEQTKEFKIAKAYAQIYRCTRDPNPTIYETYWDGLFDEMFNIKEKLSSWGYQLSIEFAESCTPQVYIPRMFEMINHI